MPQMSSSAEFQSVMGVAVTKAMYQVIERCYKELQKEIQKDIYSAYSPSDYDRTEDLLNAWKKELGHLNVSLEYEPSYVIAFPPSWQHASAYDARFGNTSAMIFDILEGGYRAYNAKTGKPIPARPMWNKFLAKVDANFAKWMRAALRKQGLQVV